ncbi:MAG TPA: ATPase, T2SS/T4P/T4SS family [Planctomycetota bacterium]|nr:ATPase, T2SS/T4P/T4SS family [Planctomycetota bacterium]HJM38896.1 ATPase, T2SS/T4P/T4SS family [Planctomycetota bacterium]
MNPEDLAPTVDLIDLLEKETGLTPAELQKLRDQAVSSGSTFDRILLNRGVAEEDMLQAFATDFDLPFLPKLEGIQVPSIFADAIPLSFARAHTMIAIGKEDDGTLTVATAHPFDLHPQDDLESLLPCPVQFVLAPRAEITELVNRAFRHKADGVDEALEDLEDTDIAGLAAELEDSEDLLDSANKAPIIKLVNSVLFQALKLRASDVHFQPYTDRMQVRFRIDGILYDMDSIPKNAQDAVLSRIKVMAKLDIAERRLPQDGRASVRIGDGEVDVRVSLVPTSAGERAVLRLLDKTAKVYTLGEMGLDEHHQKILNSYIKYPHGIILVTGPTGSGKTTTLYASLTEISTGDKNILTIEDPVEYSLDGISQVQVNTKKGLTFSAGLRSFLRQDPDVMMVGEIRDLETAEIAIRAAITGHLVFSTVHTNDAPSTVTRLIDLGLEPYLVSSSLVLVIAQRLVRTLCSACKEWCLPNDDQIAQLKGMGFDLGQLPDGKLAVSPGCTECFNSGYQGRVAIYEMLPMEEGVRALITEEATASTLKKVAVTELGMRTLRQDGLLKLADGRTSPDEIMRVTQLDVV